MRPRLNRCFHGDASARDPVVNLIDASAHACAHTYMHTETYLRSREPRAAAAAAAASPSCRRRADFALLITRHDTHSPAPCLRFPSVSVHSHVIAEGLQLRLLRRDSRQRRNAEAHARQPSRAHQLKCSEKERGEPSAAECIESGERRSIRALYLCVCA